ncbi:MAG: ComF family protein [Pusillimonas sp.]
MAHMAMLREWFGTFLALCPGDCPLCATRTRGGTLCQACAQEVCGSLLTGGARCACCCLLLDRYGVCHDCQALRPHYERVVVAFDYAFPGTLLVHQLKRQRRFLVARLLSELLARRVRASMPALANDTMLLPVPASRISLHERGFSPAAEVARHLARALRLPCRTDILFRHHEGVPQKRQGRVQRLAGAHGLYGCSPAVAGRAVALVDDVMTTGATLDRLSSVVRQAGARSVCALVLARTPLRERID